MSRIVSANDRGRFTNLRQCGGSVPGDGDATGAPFCAAIVSFTPAGDGRENPVHADGGGFWPEVVSSVTVGTPTPPSSSSPLSGTYAR